MLSQRQGQWKNWTSVCLMAKLSGLCIRIVIRVFARVVLQIYLSRYKPSFSSTFLAGPHVLYFYCLLGYRLTVICNGCSLVFHVPVGEILLKMIEVDVYLNDGHAYILHWLDVGRTVTEAGRELIPRQVICLGLIAIGSLLLWLVWDPLHALLWWRHV